MRIAILTFQFADNYGAMLQAYALRTYLISIGHDVSFVPYYPNSAKKVYSINPFIKGISLKNRIKLILNYKNHKLQNELFEHFREQYLSCNTCFSEEKQVIDYLMDYDLLICGSDQIWNNNITGNTTIYYGGDSKIKRISYAASLGTKHLTNIQKSYSEKFFPLFNKISVREKQSKELLNSIDCNIRVDLDPVFLLSCNEWNQLQSNYQITKPFMLLYLLQEDSRLLTIAINYSKENNLDLIEIHPTTAVYHRGSKHMKNVGPKEFIYLIEKTECVCTNSFHAVAFSIIFKKKLIHIPNIVSPDRTTSLLNTIGINVKDDGMNLYEFGKEQEERLNRAILDSKNYLLDETKD